MSQIYSALAAATAVAIFGATQAGAATVRLQPDEAASKDVLVYAFNVPFPPFGFSTAPNVTNLDTETLAVVDDQPTVPVSFGSLLGSAETDPFVLDPAQGPRFHTTRSLLEFDLSGVSLDRPLTRATLTLSAIGSLGAFDAPSAEFPVTTDVKQVLDAWDETEVTWETRPDVADGPLDTAIQDFAMGLVTFDVTDLVGQWLDGSTPNFGLEVSQRGVVEIPQPEGMRDRYAAGLYASSGFADASMRPYLDLEIAPVPLPAPAALLGGGLLLLGGLRRFRRQ